MNYNRVRSPQYTTMYVLLQIICAGTDEKLRITLFWLVEELCSWDKTAKILSLGCIINIPSIMIAVQMDLPFIRVVKLPDLKRLPPKVPYISLRYLRQTATVVLAGVSSRH